jgi:glutamyl-tRNA reductase
MSSKTPSLITLGLNHKTAPLKLRERLAFTPQTLLEALNSLHKLKDVEEAAIISTCNRTELYCAMSKDADQSIIDWFSSYHGLESSTIKSHLYTYDHNETIRHAMSVTCGLDSMVLGEPQIAGQMKEAYSMARQQGTLGRLLGKLFQRSLIRQIIPARFCGRQTGAHRYRHRLQPGLGRLCRSQSGETDFR